MVRSVHGSHSNTAHIYAHWRRLHASGDITIDGRSGDKRMFFDGDIAYSYRSSYPIAIQLHEGVNQPAILTPIEYYTHSTNKHIGLTRSASSHFAAQLRIPHALMREMAYFAPHLEGKFVLTNERKTAYCNSYHKFIVEYFVQTSAAIFKTFNIRTMETQYNNYIKHYTRYYDFCVLFGRKAKPACTQKALSKVLDRLHTYRAKYEKAQNDPKRKERYEKAKAAKEAKEASARQERINAFIAEYPIALEMWRKGETDKCPKEFINVVNNNNKARRWVQEDVYHLSGERVNPWDYVVNTYLHKLRVVTQSSGFRRVETSDGVKITEEQALQAFKHVTALPRIDGDTPDLNIKVGDWVINRITSKGIIAGCHRIPWSEIEYAARELGINA